MDPVWIGIAFIFGIGARMVRLPPLVGFLTAGFVLNAFDIPVTADLQEISTRRPTESKPVGFLRLFRACRQMWRSPGSGLWEDAT